MQIELKLTQHAIDQLNTRYPGWTTERLQTALNNNPTWKLGNEIHTYLGTGFDIYLGTNKEYRKRFQRRHLFLVNKIVEEGRVLAVTAVFHTHASILKWINHPETSTWNSADISANFTEYREGIKVLLIDGHDPFDIRKDAGWKYGAKGFTLRVESIN